MASRHLTAAALALALAACGGGSSTPTSPSTPPSTGGSAGGSTGGGTGGGSTAGDATVTITSSGVSPKTVTISVGGRVNFVNNDSRAHDMASDPHPIHTDCPEINTVGFLQVGQSRLTATLNTARTCGYHDHNLPDDGSLQGTIIIR